MQPYRSSMREKPAVKVTTPVRDAATGRVLMDAFSCGSFTQQLTHMRDGTAVIISTQALGY